MRLLTKAMAVLFMLSSASVFADSAISDKKLKAFGTAYTKIASISQKYKGKLQNTKNQQKALKLQNEAKGKMIKAIKTSGLGVNEYTAIMDKVRASKELQKKVFN